MSTAGLTEELRLAGEDLTRLRKTGEEQEVLTGEAETRREELLHRLHNSITHD